MIINIIFVRVIVATVTRYQSLIVINSFRLFNNLMITDVMITVIIYPVTIATITPITM